MKEPKETIMLGCPAFGGLANVQFVSSMLKITANHYVYFMWNESLITRGRNEILRAFYEDKKCTHLLFIDVDIEFPEGSVEKLLSHNKDVTASYVRLKSFNPRFNGSAPKNRNGDLVEVDKIGSAFFMLTRKAVEDLVENAKKNGDVYIDNQGRECYDIFKVGVIEGSYHSEDFYVCHELQKLGYTIYVDDSIVLTHWGSAGFNSMMGSVELPRQQKAEQPTKE